MYPSNTYYQPQMPQGPAFQRPAFQQPIQMYPQQMQPQMMPESGLQARFVSGEEEARASNVMPGMPCIFVDRANGMAYYKAIDPNTGAVDFRKMKEVQPDAQQQPQYVTAEALNALRSEFEQFVDQRIAALAAPKSTSKKGVSGNDE